MRTDSLTKFNVISSRIRLARNVDGVAFPHSAEDVEKRLALPSLIERLLRGTFNYDFFYVRDLSSVQKKALVERHLISPALVLNGAEGAAIVEKSGGLSLMINEEDHIREQCVADGFNLQGAYDRLCKVDDIILDNLPIIIDSKYGFVTACPTNFGAGMRASTMLFLPALRLANAIEDTLRVFTDRYGLTVRGVYGEGSTAFGDAYQLSNTGSFDVEEENIIEIIQRATVAMCTAEAAAREKLMRERGAEITDRIYRSYGTLRSAYSISSEELMALISDVKLGVILGLLPLKDTKPLDKLTVLFSAASLTIRIGECAPTVRDITRAKLVKDILSEVI